MLNNYDGCKVTIVPPWTFSPNDLNTCVVIDNIKYDIKQYLCCNSPY